MKKNSISIFTLSAGLFVYFLLPSSVLAATSPDDSTQIYNYSNIKYSNGTSSTSVYNQPVATSAPISIIKNPVLTINITATPPTVVEGASAVISWAATPGSTCSKSWIAEYTTGSISIRSLYYSKDTPATNVSGTYTTNVLLRPTEYSVTCRNAAGESLTKGVVVNVLPKNNTKSSLQIVAVPQTVSYGSSSTISWSAVLPSVLPYGTTGAAPTPSLYTGDCSLSWEANKKYPLTEKGTLSGSYVTSSLFTTTRYSISCKNASGVTFSKKVDVVVKPRMFTLSVNNNGPGKIIVYPINSVCSVPLCVYSVHSGTNIYLSQTVTNNRAKFTGWSGECNGAKWCTFLMNGDKKVTATFEVPIVTKISAVPSSVFYGKSATLLWSATNASSCSIVLGSTSMNVGGSPVQNVLLTGNSGNYVTSPLVATSTFSLVCIGADKRVASSSISVGVTGFSDDTPTSLKRYWSNP